VDEPAATPPALDALPPASGAAAARAGSRASWSAFAWIELAAVFLVGLCVMNFLYAGTGGVLGHEVAVPGHDSYYHVKMAELLPELGLVHKFPWLRFAWFRDSGDEFVSHHYGFHVLLVPFIWVAERLGGDALTGGRWAITFFFAASLLLFWLILMARGIGCRWLWLGLYLLMPGQFFSRHAFVRAIAPSLAFLFLIVLLLTRRRFFWAGLAVLGFTHLYFGGVIYAPVIVGCYVLAGLLGKSGERFPWRAVLWTALGWGIGIAIHPYRAGMFEFLRLQVFGTGLSPDVSVGTEWKPYENVWALTIMCAWTLIPLAAALALRLRRGPAVDAVEMCVLLVGYVFALLMFKSRRFVEYWPPFALLGAALLAGPMLTDVWGRAVAWLSRVRRPPQWAMRAAGAAVLAALSLAAVWRRGPDLKIHELTYEWRVWSVALVGFLLVPLARCWSGHAAVDAPRDAVPNRRAQLLSLLPLPGAALVTLVFTAVLFWLAGRSLPAGGGVLIVPWWCALLILVVYALVAWRRQSARSGEPATTADMPASFRLRMASLALIVAAGIAWTAALTVAAGPQLVSVQRGARGKFELPAIREAMGYLTAHSEAGSVVFTDDWDIFPVYFYVNHYNNYCVGLDPEFTHQRDPVLWERYKTITRGQTPKTYDVPGSERRSSGGQARVRIRLEDIRECFAARFVIVDRDHKPFRRKLDRAETFCERVYPPRPAPRREPGRANDRSTKAEASDDPPYVIYRVFSVEEQEQAERRSVPSGPEKPDSESVPPATSSAPSGE